MTDLATLRQQRDAARKTITTLDYTPWVSHEARTECYNRHLDALLRLHAQVVTLENAEKLENEIDNDIKKSGGTFFRGTHMIGQERGWRDCAAFLRTLIPETGR